MSQEVSKIEIDLSAKQILVLRGPLTGKDLDRIDNAIHDWLKREDDPVLVALLVPGCSVELVKADQ